MFKSAVLFAAVVCLLSCKTRDFNSSTQSRFDPSSCLAAPEDKSLPTIRATQETWTFHWTNNTSVLTPAGLKSYIKSVTESGQAPDQSRSTNVFGDGLYVAADPVISSNYGELLVVVPIKEDCEFGLSNHLAEAEDPKGRALVGSSLAGIVYQFGDPGRAIVIRNSSAIEFSKLRVVDTRANRGKRFIDVEPLSHPSPSWLDAYEYYGRLFPPFYKFPVEALKKITDGSGDFNDAGLSVMMTIGVNAADPQKVKDLVQHVNSSPTLFPYCSSNENKLALFGVELYFCQTKAIGRVMGALIDPQSESSNAISFVEATRVLKKMGYLGEASASWPEDTPAVETARAIIGIYRNAPNYRNKARRLLSVATDTTEVRKHAVLDSW